MPKPTKGPRLGGSSSHQKALLANLATSLFEHGRIKTTEPKARALRPYAEKLITHAKKGTLHNRREVMKKIRDKDVVHTLFAEIGPFFSDRDGGYTRIIKVEARKGDNAPMAVIELVREKTVTVEANRARRVGRLEEGRSSRWPQPRRRRLRSSRRPPWARLRSSPSTRSRPRTPRSRRVRTAEAGRRGRRGAEADEEADDAKSVEACMNTSPPSIPVAGLFVFGSISPTTEPSSRAGRRRPGSARWPVCSTTRCRRCSAPRCSCARPDAPTPACTPTGQVAHVDVPADALAARLSPHDRARGDSRVPAAGAAARPVPARRMCGCSTSPAPQRVSTPGSRRCAGITSIGCRPRRTASSRRRRASSRRGRARWTSTRWRRRRGTCWGCTTSPRSAVTATAPPRSGICSGWTGRATATASPPMSPPTRSAGRWCGRWSVRCWRSASTAANPVGAPRCWSRRSRSSDFAAAPAHGLTLVGVDYPPDDQLAARTEGHPRSAGRRRTRSGPRRSRRPGSPCPRRCRHWRGGRASCPPRCSGRPDCRSGRRRGTTRWSARCRAG